jgi:hypothetical protein
MVKSTSCKVRKLDEPSKPSTCLLCEGRWAKGGPPPFVSAPARKVAFGRFELPPGLVWCPVLTQAEPRSSETQARSTSFVPHTIGSSLTVTSAHSPARQDVETCRSHVARAISALDKIKPDRRFSLSKLAAFDNFQTTTSWFRIATIVSLTPIPCFLVILLVECIPLADPALGWRSSGAFQVRTIIALMCGSAASLYERAEYLPELNMTRWRVIIFSASVATASVVTNGIIMITADIFPVPLSLFTASIPTVMISSLVLKAFERHDSTRVHHDASTASGREQKMRLQTVENLQLVQSLPIWVYPIYSAVFSKLSANQQLWFTLMLVALRLGVQLLQWRATHDDEDLAGVISSASGHLFHVLFSISCLQNAKSINTLTFMLSFGTLQMLLNCRLFVRASPVSGVNALAAVMEILADDQFVRRLDCIDPTFVLSTYHRYQDERFRALHTPSPYLQWESSMHKPTQRCCSRRRVQPASSDDAAPKRTDSTSMGTRISSKTIRRARDDLMINDADTDQIARVAEACELLHHCEAVLLRSYVTIVMIMIHGTS